MQNQFSRTEILIGKENLDILKNSKVEIFGIGGVGSFVAEGLVRAGVEKFVLVDDDNICLTNINRQIHATTKTVGRPKVEVMKERILEVNPNAEVVTFKEFVLPGKTEELIFDDSDYVVDAIDTVTGKIDLIVNAKKKGLNIISAMGAGNKLDPTRFEVADVYSTAVCPLAKVMRRELRRRNIDSLKVVYSREVPVKPVEDVENSCKSKCICPPGSSRRCTEKNQIPGSISFVPSVVGMIIAGEVVRDLINIRYNLIHID